ncbi:MAG: GNAT family N-acetyltransferase [Pseudomonadota bacterium]|nr:GNAT family N-acetyltransferase [Pseudomonadota bacterium]
MTRNTPSIHPTKPEDLDELARVYAAVYGHFQVGEKWTPETALRLLEYWFRRNPELCFTAFAGDRPVGAFFADVKPWWDGNHLVDGEVFVHPDFQKQDIGRQLSIRLYETALEKYQVTSFDTYTFRNNGHPLSWYRKQGFAEVTEWSLISGDVRQALEFLKQEGQQA